MKPVLEVLAGRRTEYLPVWLMRQAGRYLPEYRALRAQAGSFLALCLNPDLAAAVTLQPVCRFGMDAAILFSDILMVPYGLGQQLDYREGEGPVLEPVRTANDLDRLSPQEVRGRLDPIFGTVSAVRAAQPAGCTLIGFAGGVWTVAAYMIEGKGGGEFQAAKAMAYAEPALLDRLIALLEDTTVDYLGCQIEAGAEAVQLFDSWAGILEPSLFARYVIAPTARIVKRLKAAHPAIPVIGFPRLGGLNIPAYARLTGVDAMGLDTTVPLHDAARLGLPIQGNLDPALLLIGGAVLEAGVRGVVADGARQPHIFNLGHGVSQHTDPGEVARLVDCVRKAA